MQDQSGAARVGLGGLTFEVGPAVRLHADELSWLAGFPAAAAATAHLRLALREDEPQDWAPHELLEGQPAQVEAVGPAVRVRHRLFCAELCPGDGQGWLYRARPPLGLAITLRVAQACLLPRQGLLPLHAAGLELDGAGLVFFGVSGAGKSTLAGLAPGPVFSDELVVAGGEPPELRASGFWGELGEGRAVRPAPLAALFELDKQPALTLRRLSAAEAFRGLLAVTLVPPERTAWQAALSVLGQLSREVPVWRLGWRPEEPPWESLRGLLAPLPLAGRR